MTTFAIVLAFGMVAFWATVEAIFKPKAKRHRVAMVDVWASIASAPKAVDESYRLIYGKTGTD